MVCGEGGGGVGTWRRVSMIAGPWVVRMCLERPCKDMLRNASRVRGRFSAIRLTCLRPRKAFLGEMSAMVCSRAFVTMALWHCSSCMGHACQDWFGVGDAFGTC